MKRFLACALSVAMLSSVAMAQTVSLSDAADGDGVVDIAVPGGTGTVNLWLNAPVGLSIMGMDAILVGYDNAFGLAENFEVSGFIDAPLLAGKMQRTGRGAVAGALPGNVDGYQYVGDDLNFPADANSGYAGTGLDVLLDSIIMTGLAETVLGPDYLYFSFAAAPQYFDVALVDPPGPPPPAWSIGGPFAFGQGTGDGLSPLEINIAPEPASLALLAIGGFAAIRRRR